MESGPVKQGAKGGAAIDWTRAESPFSVWRAEWTKLGGTRIGFLDIH